MYTTILFASLLGAIIAGFFGRYIGVRASEILTFTASNISSIDIKMMMTFLRLMKIPKMPSVKRIAARVR